MKNGGHEQKQQWPSEGGFPRQAGLMYLANVWSETIISQRCPFVHVWNKLQIRQKPKEQGTPERPWSSGFFFFFFFFFFFAFLSFIF